MKITADYSSNITNIQNTYRKKPFKTQTDVFEASVNANKITFGQNRPLNKFEEIRLYIKKRADIKKRIKEHNLEQLNLLEYCTPERIQLVDTILSNSELCGNKEFMNKLPLVLASIQNGEEAQCKIKLLDSLLSDERLYKNKRLTDNCAEILLRTKNQSITESKIGVVNKILSDENLLNLMNADISSPIVNIITGVHCKNQVQLATEVFSCPKLYNNYEFMLNAERVICSNDRDIIATTEIVKKASADVKLHSEKAIEHLGNIIEYPFPDFKFVLAQYNPDDFRKIMLSTIDKLSARQISSCLLTRKMLDIIDSGLLETNKELIKSINNANISRDAEKELLCRIFCLSDNNYSNMDLRQKRNLIDVMQEIISSDALDNETKTRLNIEKDFEKLKKSLVRTITPTEVSQENAVAMMKGFFTNNDEKLDNLLSSTDFTIYEKNGLPLSYSRKQFLDDLNTLTSNLPEEQKSEILNKMDIELSNSGYNGIIDLTKLSKDGVEGDVLTIAEKFIRHNSVRTGNKELDKALDSLINGMPEFINIIGKKQHNTHDYSLDIHILSVLKEALSNPEYKKLTDEEKFCLKFAIILHDIAKPEGVKDANHPYLSSLYAKDILNKSAIKLPRNIKIRIFELVKNHHWLADYNNQKKTPQETAGLFRRKGDFKIAQIMTEADLKSVDREHKFYNKYSSSLTEDSLWAIENELNHINKYGQIFLPSKIIDYKKLAQKATIEYKGKEYQVIDFTGLDNNTDLSEYGFEPDTTPADIRLLVHTVKDWKTNDLENVLYFEDPANEGFLCTSYVTVQNHPTYSENRIGVSVSSENVNIANASSSNQNSGHGKSFSDFTEIITSHQRSQSHRTTIPDTIKTELNLTNAEYIILYNKLQQLQYISQLDNIETIKIGNKEISAKQIKNAVLKAEDEIINQNNEHNEVNIYNPKVNAVVAKVNYMDDIPKQLLDFAYTHKLPIFLLGK